MGKGRRVSWSNLDVFRRQMEHLLDEGGSCSPGEYAGYVWTPQADLLESGQELLALVELPGVRPEQVVVEIVDGDLVVRGERASELPQACEDADTVYHLLERSHGGFARRFSLPPGVDGEAVSATLSNGLLTVRIPKLTSRAPARFTLPVG